MKAIPTCAVLALAFAVTTTAQLGPKYADWGDGPAQHLMTTRVRINNGRKIGLMINSLLVQKMNWL